MLLWHDTCRLYFWSYWSYQNGWHHWSEHICDSFLSTIFNIPAQTNIGEIDWSLVFSVLLAKGLIFLMVVLITLMVTKPMDIGRAGLFVIICTQSNDFAFGYPIFVSLYSNTHPAFPNYLYVLAPLQLIILNPIGLFLMEFSKSRASIYH